MKETFIPRRFSAKSKVKLAQLSEILEVYKEEKVTDRQLYYQMVAKFNYPNSTPSYNNFCGLVRDARLSGCIDWDIIEDRSRTPNKPSQFDGIRDGIATLIGSYRLDRWVEQKNYVEVWVEKDALSAVFTPITDQYHVLLMANHGYPSITVIHDASVRFKQAAERGKACTVLYFGDHDPSGLHMTDSIGETLNSTFGCSVTVIRVALTTEQVHMHKLPPNPAKLTDPRSKKYVAEHGEGSWELDALPPDVLRKLLTDAIMEYLELDAFDRIIQKEESDKSELARIAEQTGL